MVTKPSTPRNAVDARLRALADPVLADRLIAEHPELYAEPKSDSPTLHHRESAAPAVAGAESQGSPRTPSRSRRMLAIVGLLVAVGASYALGALMRSRVGADVVPSVSLVPPAPGILVRRGSVSHDNLGPAAARKLELVHARLAKVQSETAGHTIAIRIPAQYAAPQTQHVVPPRTHADIPAPQTRSAPSPKFRDQVSTLHSSLVVSSVAADAPAAASSASNAGDSADASAQSPNAGRQIPSGPVWSENGPGVVIPGGVVIAGGRFPGGGGMPGGCPRGRLRP